MECLLCFLEQALFQYAEAVDEINGKLSNCRNLNVIMQFKSLS